MHECISRLARVLIWFLQLYCKKTAFYLVYIDISGMWGSECWIGQKRSLIQDAKKKMDDAKEVSNQYRSLDGQFKSLSKDQEDLRFNLLNIEVIFYWKPSKNVITIS